MAQKFKIRKGDRVVVLTGREIADRVRTGRAAQAS